MQLQMRVELDPGRPRAELKLADGADLVLGPLTRDDRDFLVEGLTELSVESRFARFGLGKSNLSEGELDYLTDVDQRSHVAWAAIVDGMGAGIARYIVGGDGCAEMAVTVVDEYQGRGVGRALLDALSAVARHDGISELCFEVLSANRRVLEILARLPVVTTMEGDVVQGRLRLGPTEDGDEVFVEVIEAHRAMR